MIERITKNEERLDKALLSVKELEKALDAVGWCDVCKGWEE